MKLSCPMNLKTYPHDTQRCKMQIESSEYPDSSW